VWSRGEMVKLINKISGDSKWWTGQRGMTLIETLIAISILSVIAAAFLTSMTTAAHTTFIVQKRATAEGLAKSQMEYIKRQDYKVDGDYKKLTGLPQGYDLDIVAERLNPRGDSTINDDGLQKIVIIVRYHSDEVLRLEGYKCFQRY